MEARNVPGHLSAQMGSSNRLAGAGGDKEQARGFGTFTSSTYVQATSLFDQVRKVSGLVAKGGRGSGRLLAPGKPGKASEPVTSLAWPLLSLSSLYCGRPQAAVQQGAKIGKRRYNIPVSALNVCGGGQAGKARSNSEH